MKARTIALVLLLSAVTVCAQTPPTKKVAPATTQAKPAVPAAAPSPAAKPAAVKPATPSPAAKPAAVKPATPSPAAKPAAAKPAVPAPAKAATPVAKPAKPAVAKAAKPAAKRVKPAVAKAPATMAKAKAKPKGKRDPFVSPIVHSEGVVACATGKKCLPVDSIVLKGIVKSQAGMIAVVEGSSRKISYFLRENDPVFNGYVVKITRDSVVFRENVIDPVGRQSTRDVVKKVVAPVV